MFNTSDGEVTLTHDDKEYTFPTVSGTEGDVGVDISRLRGDHKKITLDYGFANTAACRSSITYVNGDTGELRYRGYKIEELAAKATFPEVAYLLINGELPTRTELVAYEDELRTHSLLNEEMKAMFDAFPRGAHPMGILSSATAAMSTFYERYHDPRDTEAVKESALRLMAKLPTVAAFAYKKSIGQPYMYPRNDLDYSSNFLHMMFGLPVEPYEIDPVVARALDVLLILHADHEQNCSTSTVRLVGSSEANLFASVAGGMNALWGPLHGGANSAVISMLTDIDEDGGDVDKYVAKAKDKDDPFRLMGFGHRVYKNYDPRAKVMRATCYEVLGELGVENEPL
ncbi:MAG: citrate (Si)-synthase, partial [Acidimicrobiia bacterium]|nr:citrate (Si)-synthase [Acidimicrobiia bacterium]